MVDCSIGTPCDPPPPRRRRGAGDVGHRAGLPAVGGQPAAARGRGGLAGPALRAGRRRRRRRWPPAWGPRSSSPRCRTCSACARRDRDTVLYPAVSYPTYAMGAELAGCRAVPVPPSPGRLGGLDLDAIDPADAGARPGAVVELAVEPDRGPGRPRRGGGLGPGARRPGVLRRVLRRVHLGRPAALDPRSTAPTAWWPCTRCPSARTWPACASASTPATPSWSSSCAPCASTPASWSRARPRPPAWPPSATTSTWRPSGRATGSAWPSWPASSGAYGCPVDASRGRLLPVGPGAGRPLARRLGHGRGAGHRRRAPGQPRRPLRRRRRRPRARGRGPADGAAGAGGGAPRLGCSHG